MIEWILYATAVSIFFLMMFLHELGHRKMAWHLGYDAKIKTHHKKGKLLPDIVTEWEADENPEHERKILLAGIMTGLVPFFFMVFLIDWFGAWLVLMVMILYYIVSRHDIARLLELYEDEEDEM